MPNRTLGRGEGGGGQWMDGEQSKVLFWRRLYLLRRTAPTLLPPLTEPPRAERGMLFRGSFRRSPFGPIGSGSNTAVSTPNTSVEINPLRPPPAPRPPAPRPVVNKNQKGRYLRISRFGFGSYLYCSLFFGF